MASYIFIDLEKNKYGVLKSMQKVADNTDGKYTKIMIQWRITEFAGNNKNPKKYIIDDRFIVLPVSKIDELNQDDELRENIEKMIKNQMFL